MIRVCALAFAVSACASAIERRYVRSVTVLEHELVVVRCPISTINAGGLEGCTSTVTAIPTPKLAGKDAK